MNTTVGVGGGGGGGGRKLSSCDSIYNSDIS